MIFLSGSVMEDTDSVFGSTVLSEHGVRNYQD